MDRIVDKVKQVILQPYDAIETYKSEEIDIVSTIKEYVLILAAIPSVSIFIGLIGRVNELGEPISFGANIIFSALLYGVLILGLFLNSKIISFLAPHFGSEKNNNNAFKISFYSFIPAFAAGIFNLNPSLSFLWFLGSVYGGYIFYIGAPIIIGTSEEKKLGYTITTGILTYAVIITLIKIILSWTIGADLPSFR